MYFCDMILMTLLINNICDFKIKLNLLIIINSSYRQPCILEMRMMESLQALFWKIWVIVFKSTLYWDSQLIQFFFNLTKRFCLLLSNKEWNSWFNKCLETRWIYWKLKTFEKGTLYVDKSDPKIAKLFGNTYIFKLHSWVFVSKSKW